MIFNFIANSSFALAVSALLLFATTGVNALFPSAAGHFQTGLDGQPACDGGIDFKTNDCDSPFPSGIDNGCDFIGCERVNPQDHNAVISSNGCLNGQQLYFSNEDDWAVAFYDPSEDYFMEEDEDDTVVCVQMAICELGDPQVDSICHDPKYAEPSGTPTETGRCGDPNPEDSGFVCRTCSRKTQYTLAELTLITNNTVQRLIYDVNQNCQSGPPGAQPLP